MPLDPRAKRLLELLAATDPQSALSQSVAERRRSLASLARFSGTPEPVASVEDTSVPGSAGPIPIRVYTPEGASPGPSPALVYFHGGGLVAGDLDTHDGVARALSNASECRLFSVDYRLAPEHRFPGAIEDAYAAAVQIARSAAELGVDPGRLGVCGDSAGATLAAAVCQKAGRSGELRLAVQLLICPIMDYAGETESRRELGEGYLLDRLTLEHDLLHYLTPGTDPADPLVSPLRADDLSGLPPTLIHTAEFDPLRDEGRAYADRLTGAGLEAAYTCHAGMIHLFYALGAVIPYAREAYRVIGRQVRDVLR